MGETKLNFVLMGKTGKGKSATGNTILNRKVFKVYGGIFSETKSVNFNFAQFDNFMLQVVDGPGLNDTDQDMAENITSIAKHMDTALAMCNGGVDSFLFVIKFGTRFTHEDEMSLQFLKRLFGRELFNHFIVVVTCGDIFHAYMEEEGEHKSFHEWCVENKNSAFRTLYNDCQGRFVLLNNRERDEEKKRAQVNELVKLAHDMQRRSGRYTSQCYSEVKYEREKLILEMRAPWLNVEFQRKIAFMVTSIKELFSHPSDDANEKVRVGVLELRKEIDQEDQGYNILKELKETMTNVEDMLDQVEKRITNRRRSDEGFLERFTRLFTR